MKCRFCSKHNPSLRHRIRCAAVYILIVYPYLYLWRLTLEELFVRLRDRLFKYTANNQSKTSMQRCWVCMKPMRSKLHYLKCVTLYVFVYFPALLVIHFIYLKLRKRFCQ
jgi:hypothetical protein